VLAGQRQAEASLVRVEDAPLEARGASSAGYESSCSGGAAAQRVPTAHVVAENLAFRTFHEPPEARAGWLVSRDTLREWARELIARFGIRTTRPEARLDTPSGGNVHAAAHVIRPPND
jgi:simple sugar transport system ATP-binding protein